jgi:hypothetical protein
MHHEELRDLRQVTCTELEAGGPSELTLEFWKLEADGSRGDGGAQHMYRAKDIADGRSWEGELNNVITFELGVEEAASALHRQAQLIVTLDGMATPAYDTEEEKS